MPSRMATRSPDLTPPATHAAGGDRVMTWTYALLILAVVLFTAASVFGVYKLREKTEDAATSSQATVWLVVSFEREYLKLGNMLSQYRLDPSAIDADTLLTQFDVFWSRIDLLQQGVNAEPLRQIGSHAEVVPATLDLLREYEQQVFDAVPAGRPIDPAFLGRFRALAEPIHRYAVDVHLNRSWVVDVREAQSADTRFAIHLTLVGTLASTLIIFAILLVQLRSRHGNLLRTMSALEQSRRDSKALRDEVVYRESVEAEREALLTDLESRNEELERYAYTISHDLKSPLYTIQGYTGFLERDAKKGHTGNMLGDLDKIKDAVDTMGKLLEDILNLSKVSLVAESMQRVPLADVVAGAMSLVQREISEHGVIVQYEPDLPQVEGDPQRLTEVFQNLIGNAAKFMGEQPRPLIEIGARIDGDWVECYVSDNGIGIASEYRERVFNLFERLDTRTQGTGIGLAIVKRIVERHGGRIWVESAGEGQGSRFGFTLPRAV